MGGVGIGAACLATGGELGWSAGTALRIVRLDQGATLNPIGLAAAPLGIAYFLGCTVGGTGLGVTAGTATGGATGTATGFARGSFGWCTHEAFVPPMCD